MRDVTDRSGARRGPDFPASRVRGQVLVPGDASYDEERSGFQAGYSHRPDVVVRAADADDVAVAVGHAAARDAPLAVQATGHGLASPLQGGVLISTRAMTDVRVDASARTARIGAGVRWGSVVEEAARFGLAPLSGSGPGVGAVSYVLGGGVGLLARQYGYAADHVRSVDVVTAEGGPRHLTAESEGDLFWALCGGGPGNFGVVTGMEVGLVPLERFYGGRLVFDGELAPDVLEGWGKWTEDLPEELTSSVSLLIHPDVPAVPGPLRGRYVAQVQIAFDGTESEGERLIGPLRAIGPRVSETLRMMPYTESARVYDEPDRPHAYQGGNVLLGERLPDAAALRPVLELTGPDAPVTTVLSLRHMGGALGRQAAVPNAVGRQDAGHLMVVLSVTEGTGASREVEVTGLHERVFETVAPWTVGSDLNFRYGRPSQALRLGSRPAAHDRTSLRRLADVKALVDPADLFRFHQGAP